MHKNIDDIFKDKLKDFKATPSPKVWDGILTNLPQKKKRRILPMWWFSGVAAVFILALFLIPFSNNNSNKLPIKEEVIIVNSNEIKEKTDSIITQKDNKPLVASPYKEKKKETITVATKKSFKKSPQKIIIAKNSSDLVDAKIAVNKVKPVVKSAMKKIFTKKKEENTILRKEPISITKPIKHLVAETPKKEEKFDFKKQPKKWSLTPVVAVLASNSFSNNSPLDESLAGNPTKGNNSLSYGVKVEYQLTKKWGIQTGIHIQKTNYTNNNLSIISNVSGSGLSGLNSNASFSLSSPSNNITFLTGAKIISSKANLTQTYGYVEVPIEVKYTLLENTKFSSKLVSGFSSLFLNNNYVFVDSDVLSEKVGEANNLNSWNFSGNFGIDLDYSINTNFKLNINPMFKVQLNTFSKNSNGFKPYILGVYSGIKYQF